MSASSLPPVEHFARWSKPAAMPRSQTRPEPQRTTAVEIGLGNDQIMVFRGEAARRSTTRRLVNAGRQCRGPRHNAVAYLNTQTVQLGILAASRRRLRATCCPHADGVRADFAERILGR
jgi:hypothetical protein